MKNTLILLGMLTLSVAFTSCLSNTKSDVAFHEETFTSPDDAIVYVYRVKAFAAAAVAWNVYLDDKVVAKLKQNSYVTLHVPAGVHSFRIGDKPRMFGGVVDQIAQSAAYNALDHTDTATGALQSVKPHEIYYFRSQGLSSRQMTREAAMLELSTMKQDTGM